MKFSFKILFFVALFTFQSAFSQNDCMTAIVACGNTSYNNLSVFGVGTDVEINNNNSCQGQENNIIWIKVNIKTPGTLGFKITPANRDIEVDFDFYVFGPNANCNNLGTAIRCSTTNPKASNSSNNTTGMNATETDASEGPGSLGNNYLKWLDVLANETYYLAIDRFTGDSDFDLNWTGSATFNEPPTINPNTGGQSFDIEKCETDPVLDQVTNFNLTQNSAAAIGSQLNVIGSYHTFESDAITGNSPVLNPTNFINTSNPQKIFLRLTNTITGCSAYSTFNLNIIPFPSLDPDDLSKCDLNNDGFETFNLTDNTAKLINNTPNIVVSYHGNENDAVSIPNNYTNQIANTDQIIWARIKNSITGCYVNKPFKIIVNKLPTVVSTQITQCDFEFMPDGKTIFNLNEANAVLTNNNADYKTTFFLNIPDAAANSNIQPTIFTNSTNPQTLVVRVTNSITGCFSLSTLVLNVSVNPTQTKSLINCDDDGIEDGKYKFNIDTTGFLNSGNTVTYFPTSNDALAETNEIPAIFENTNPYQQTVYARVENNNNCLGIHIINLIVNPLPDFEIENNDFLCTNLPAKSIKIKAKIQTGNPVDFSYLWTPTNETTPTISILNGGTYTAEVTNISTNCKKTKTIIVEPSSIATVLNTEIVDLSVNNSINIKSIGTGNYVYSLDDEFNFYQTSSLFDNVSAGIHLVYIKDLNGCGILTKEINVLGTPRFFTPNNDGVNDFWNVAGINHNFNSNATIYIYNRHGKLLKQIVPTGIGWDGTYNSIPLTADDYWFSIKFEDGRSAKGHFSLKR